MAEHSTVAGDARSLPPPAPVGVGPDDRRGARLRWMVLALLLAAAAAARIAAIYTVGDVAVQHGDEGYYLDGSRSLYEGTGYPGAKRPPAYAVFLTAVRATAGSDLATLRLAQVPIALLAIAIVFDLLVRRFGLAAATLSAALLAFNPTLVQYTSLLWAETLVATLLLAVVWALARFEDGQRVAWLVLAALVLGAAALTREMALYAAPLLALWVARPRTARRTREAALFLLVVVLCVVPWTVRNYLAFDRFVLISTHRWFPVAEGNLMTEHGPRARKQVRDFRRRYRALPTEVERDAFARAVALGSIARQQPWWLVAKLRWNPYLLFAPKRSQLARYLENGWLAPRWRGAAERLRRLDTVLYVVGMCAGLAGLWLVPDPRIKLPILALLAVFVAVYVAGNATNRFRVPLLPLLLLYAGPLLCGRFAASRWRVAGAVVTVGAFVAIVAVDVLWRPVIGITQY